MAQIEIGQGKSARRGYALDEVSIVPSRRTRDADDVDTSWQLDAFTFEVPLVCIGEPSLPGALSVIDAETHLTADGGFDAAALTAAIAEAGEVGVSAVSVRPQRAEALLAALGRTEPDLLVIRGRVVSAEHVSRTREPLNLKRTVRQIEVPVIVGSCSSFQAALHLMRTGGDVAKAIVCGADAVLVEPSDAAADGPAGPGGLVGELRRTMATCGYESTKEFQAAELVVIA